MPDTHAIRVRVAHECPPIPPRGAEWSAHDDRLDADCSAHGYGANAGEAIVALLDDMGLSLRAMTWTSPTTAICEVAEITEETE